MKKPRMTSQQIGKLERLLWMEYKPSEIAEEIGISTDTLYKSYIPAGCPHRRDNHSQIWIVGSEFAEWARLTFSKTKKPRAMMGPNQAYCMKCRKAVDISEVKSNERKKHLEFLSGVCPICGSAVYRARSK